MSAGQKKPTAAAPVGTAYSSRRNELAEIRAAQTAPPSSGVAANAPVSRAMDDDDFEPTVKAASTPPPPPPPVATRPSQPSAPPSKPADERPGPVVRVVRMLVEPDLNH